MSTNRLAVCLTHEGRDRFLSWVNGVKLPAVCACVCLSEFEAELGNNDQHYELSSSYTLSGRPETISFDETEIFWEEGDDE